MSQWAEIHADVLFVDGSRIVLAWEDVTVSLKVNSFSHHGSLVGTAPNGKILWKYTVVKGHHAYRITAGGVRRLPVIQRDPDVPRRLARTLGWPLTWIVALKGSDHYTYHPRHQGDDGRYMLPVGSNIKVVRFWVDDNPEFITRIFVRKGANITWKEAEKELRRFVGFGQKLPTFEEAVRQASLKRS